MLEWYSSILSSTKYNLPYDLYKRASTSHIHTSLLITIINNVKNNLANYIRMIYARADINCNIKIAFIYPANEFFAAPQLRAAMERKCRSAVIITGS